MHNAKARGKLTPHRDGGHGQFRIPLHMRGNDFAKVHPVQLVSTQNQHILKVIVQDVDQVLPNGIGRALVPRVARRGLLCCKDVNKTLRKVVELVGVGNMPMQRGRVELSQQINLVEPGVDAVRDGDVHQAILPGQWHGRL